MFTIVLLMLHRCYSMTTRSGRIFRRIFRTSKSETTNVTDSDDTFNTNTRTTPTSTMLKRRRIQVKQSSDKHIKPNKSDYPTLAADLWIRRLPSVILTEVVAFLDGVDITHSVMRTCVTWRSQLESHIESIELVRYLPTRDMTLHRRRLNTLIAGQDTTSAVQIGLLQRLTRLRRLILTVDKNTTPPYSLLVLDEYTPIFHSLHTLANLRELELERFKLMPTSFGHFPPNLTSLKLFKFDYIDAKNDNTRIRQSNIFNELSCASSLIHLSMNVRMNNVYVAEVPSKYYCCEYIDFDPDSFSTMTSLKSLHVSQWNNYMIRTRLPSIFTRLTHLNLESYQLFFKETSEELGRCTQLRSLTLSSAISASGQLLPDDRNVLLHPLSRLVNLEVLQIGSLKEVDLVVMLQGTTNLTSLTLMDWTGFGERISNRLPTALEQHPTILLMLKTVKTNNEVVIRKLAHLRPSIECELIMSTIGDTWGGELPH